MNLDLYPVRADMAYDEHDANSIFFATKDGYFVVETCVYLENDDENITFNDPYFEWNDQINSQCGGIKCITFFDEKIVLIFEMPRLFKRKYSTITLNLSQPVPVKIVDFFNNALFLGDYVVYDDNFPKEKMIKQTEFREYLDEK